MKKILLAGQLCLIALIVFFNVPARAAHFNETKRPLSSSPGTMVSGQIFNVSLTQDTSISDADSLPCHLQIDTSSRSYSVVPDPGENPGDPVCVSYCYTDSGSASASGSGFSATAGNGSGSIAPACNTSGFSNPVRVLINPGASQTVPFSTGPKNGTSFSTDICNKFDAVIGDLIRLEYGAYALAVRGTAAGNAEAHSTLSFTADIASGACSPPPILTITKTHTGGCTQGQTGMTYSITVSNTGAGPTVGTITVVETPPAGMHSCGLSGTGWTCNPATLTCTRSDVLAPGASFPPITLTADIAEDAPPLLVNSATVFGSGAPDGITATDPTTVEPLSPILTITKTHTGGCTQGQTGMTYSITVSNTGTGPTVGTITVVETPPAGMHSCGLSGTGWTCNPVTLTCTRNDVLAPGASFPPITLTANIAEDASPLLVNSATVFGSGAPGGITATDPTTVDPLSAQPAKVPVMGGLSSVLFIILAGFGGAYYLRRTRRGGS